MVDHNKFDIESYLIESNPDDFTSMREKSSRVGTGLSHTGGFVDGPAVRLSCIKNDPTGYVEPALPGGSWTIGTSAERLVYPTAWLRASDCWFETDNLLPYQWTGAGWVAFGGGGSGGPLATGLVTLSGGLATVMTAYATSSRRYVLVCQDVNCLGTPRVDTVVNGVSFVINSTGNTDDGVIYWQIWN